MATVASVLLSVREGDFLASIDLKGAYFQIPVHQSSRKLLRFLSGGVVYQFKALCFGLSTAPQVFIRVFTVVYSWAHSRRIRLLWYLDGWLVLVPLEAVTKKNIQDLLSLCHSLGASDKREVRSRPLSYCKLLRYDLRYWGRQDFSCHGAGGEISVGGGEISCFVESPLSAMAGAFGAPGVAGEVGSSQLSLNALPSVAFENALDPRVGSSLASSTSVLGGEVGSLLGLIRDTSSGPSPVLGRVSVRVGRTPPRSFRVRGVVGGGAVVAHQSSRDKGTVSGIAVISGDSHWSSGDCDVRQLNGIGLHQWARRDGVPFPLLVGWPPSQVDGESRRPPGCEVSTRTVQCPGQSPQPSGSGYRDRVVYPPAGGESASSCLGLPVA